MSGIRAGLNRSWVVGAAELLRTVRDPHVLAYLVAPLALYPVLTWATMQWLESPAPDGAPTVAVQAPPALVQDLEDAGLALVEHRGAADVAVTTVHDELRWSVSVEVLRPRPRARRALRMVERALDETRAHRTAELLASRGVSVPVRHDVVYVPVQGEAHVTGRIVGIASAVAWVMAMLVGAVYPAIDVVVAERERNTAEALWVTPVPRWSLLIGKVGACAVLVGAVGVSHGVACAVTTSRLAGSLVVNQWPVMGTVAGMMVLPGVMATAGFIAVANVVLATFARTFKEGEMLGTIGVILGTVPCAVAAGALATGRAASLEVVPVASTVVALQRAGDGTLTMAGAASLLILHLCLIFGLLGLVGALRPGWAAPSRQS